MGFIYNIIIWVVGFLNPMSIKRQRENALLRDCCFSPEPGIEGDQIRHNITSCDQYSHSSLVLCRSQRL